MAISAGGRSPAQTFALALGVAYLAVGLIGFAVTGSGTGTLIIFDLNVLHNIVHIALGLAWLVASRSAATAKTVNLVIGVVLVLVALLGFVGVVVPDLIAANSADHVLHLVTGAASVFFGSMGATAGRPATA